MGELLRELATRLQKRGRLSHEQKPRIQSSNMFVSFAGKSSTDSLIWSEQSRKLPANSNPVSFHLLRSSTIPITALRKQRRQIPQPLLIHLVEPSHLRTINIDNRNYLRPPISTATQPILRQYLSIPTHLPTFPTQNRHHNLAPTLPIASYMPRKLTDVRDSQYLFFSGGGTAHAPADGDALACRAAVEGTEE